MYDPLCNPLDVSKQEYNKKLYERDNATDQTEYKTFSKAKSIRLQFLTKIRTLLFFQEIKSKILSRP